MRDIDNDPEKNEIPNIFSVEFKVITFYRIIMLRPTDDDAKSRSSFLPFVSWSKDPICIVT